MTKPKDSNPTLWQPILTVRTWWSTPSPPIAGIMAGTFGCLFAFKPWWSPFPTTAVGTLRAFWRSLRHHETAPTRFDIDVDFDGGGTAGDVHTWIHLADDDPG